MKSNRQEKLLELIVKNYIEEMTPIGSKKLQNLYEEKLSPATLRNDMNKLESLGLLEKVHNSSGRIPSKLGYETYLQSILKVKTEPTQDITNYINEIFEQYKLDDQAIDKTINTIASISNFAVLTSQTSQNDTLKSLNIFPIDENEVIVVVLTSSNKIDNQRLTVPEGITQNQFIDLFKQTEKLLVGSKLVQISNILELEVKPMIKTYVKAYHEFMNTLVKVFVHAAVNKVYLSGAVNIFKNEDFQNIDQLKDISEVFLEKKYLDFIKTISQNDCIDVHITDDNLSVFSLPEINNQTISLITPSRVDYEKILALLNYLVKKDKEN
jgi:heat-inducible transcriptional repressor